MCYFHVSTAHLKKLNFLLYGLTLKILRPGLHIETPSQRPNNNNKKVRHSVCMCRYVQVVQVLLEGGDIGSPGAGGNRQL